MRVLASLAFVLLASTWCGVRADVLVVSASGGPGTDFTTLPPAIAAAANGDTLLIRSGNYGPSTIDGKSLVLVGDATSGIPAIGPLKVKNLAVHQSVTVQAIEITAANSTVLPTATVTATDCAGHLSFDRCRIALGSDSLVIDDCDEVILSRCEVIGGDQFLAFFFEIPTGAAVRIDSSRIAIFDSVLTGGNGSQGAEGFAFDELVESGHGASAVTVSGASQVSLVASDLLGGSGGNGFFAPIFGLCFPPGTGASALRVVDSGPSVRVLSSSLTAGVEGTAEGGCPQPGTVAPPIGGPGASGVLSLPYLDRDYGFDSPVRAGQSTSVSFTGAPADLVFLFLSPAPDFTDLPGIPTTLEPALPAQVLALGSIPGSGSLSFNVGLPQLPPGVDVAVLYTQPAFAGIGSPIALAEPQTLVVLSSSF